MLAVYTDTLFTLLRDNTAPDDPARTYVRRFLFFLHILNAVKSSGTNGDGKAERKHRDVTNTDRSFSTCINPSSAFSGDVINIVVLFVCSVLRPTPCG